MAKRKDELKEEFDKIATMSSYDRLAYIRNLAKFHKQFLDIADEEYIKDFIDTLLVATKGYGK